MLNLSDDRYQFILEKFTDNRRPPVDDGNKKIKQVKIRQNQWNKFKELCGKLSTKNLKLFIKILRSKKLLHTVAHNFNAEEITAIKITRYTQKYNAKKDCIDKVSEAQMGEVDFFKTQKLTDFLDFFVKDEKFPFAFMLKLLNKIDRQKIKNNPKKARKRLLEILKDTIARDDFKRCKL